VALRSRRDRRGPRRRRRRRWGTARHVTEWEGLLGASLLGFDAAGRLWLGGSFSDLDLFGRRLVAQGESDVYVVGLQ
jgi:hypothetical protein